MCAVVKYKGKDIETANELEAVLALRVIVLDSNYTEVNNSCLCCIDIEKTLQQNNIKYMKNDFGDFYINNYD